MGKDEREIENEQTTGRKTREINGWMKIGDFNNNRGYLFDKEVYCCCR